MDQASLSYLGNSIKQEHWIVTSHNGKEHEVDPSRVSKDTLIDRLLLHNSQNPAIPKSFHIRTAIQPLYAAFQYDDNILILTVTEVHKLLAKIYVLVVWYGSILFVPYSNLLSKILRDMDTEYVFMVDPGWIAEQKIQTQTVTTETRVI